MCARAIFFPSDVTKPPENTENRKRHRNGMHVIAPHTYIKKLSFNEHPQHGKFLAPLSLSARSLYCNGNRFDDSPQIAFIRVRFWYVRQLIMLQCVLVLLLLRFFFPNFFLRFAPFRSRERRPGEVVMWCGENAAV